MGLQNYPVPELDSTLTEIKEIFQRMFSESDYAIFQKTLENAYEVMKSNNLVFHDSVKEKKNWATEMFQQHLLSIREPIPFSTAVGCILKPLEFQMSQRDQAVTLLHAIANLFSTPSLLQISEKWETTQQKNMFATCRIPGETKDELVNHPESRHAIVVFKAHVFVVDILDENGNPMDILIIRDSITSIMESNKIEADAKNSICYYTALNRNEWARHYQKMLNDPFVKPSLEKFHNAIVTLILEDDVLDLSKPDAAFQSFQKSKLRNFDQTTNIVVYENSVTGLICEHTAVDGLIISELALALKEFTKKSQQTDQISPTPTISLMPLNFKLEVSVVNVPNEKLIQKITYFDFDLYPDIIDLLKEYRIYDSWIVLALQLALKQTFDDKTLLTVFPTHVRHFVEGRCDPTYVASKESTQLTKFLESINPITLITDENQAMKGLKLFWASLETLKNKVKKTKMGEAIGTHIGIIRRMLNDEHQELKTMLEAFATPSVILTGDSNIFEAVEFGTGNIYAQNQLCVNYLGDKDKVRITLRASGLFAEKLPQLQDNLKTSMKTMLIFAVQLGIIKQMDAIEIIQNTFSDPQKTNETQQNFALAIHGGAGEMFAMMPEMSAIINFALRIAILVGVESLKKFQNSVDAVEASVKAMEDCFIFNAGKGAVYNCKGEHELEAAIMDGKSGKAGAVACIKNLKNPICAAKKIMKNCKHVFLNGKSAEEFCDDLDKVDQKYFDTDLRKKQFEAVINSFNNNNNDKNDYFKHPQTVGAVAIDQNGRLAAATSTGGMVNKMDERIGDTAIIGAATWADDKVAISCTGDGEAFLRKCVASKIASKNGNNIDDLQQTCINILDHDLKNILAGMIVIDSNGNIVGLTNAQMFFASYKNGKISTKIAYSGDHMDGKNGGGETNYAEKIIAPKSWVDPILHSKIAITNKWYTGVFKLQDTLFHSTIDYFRKQCGYSYVMTPLSTSTISSPMGLGSDSLPVSVNLFGENIYLADSMQFTLEYFLRVQDGIPGTYYVSPSFRGEDPDATHLNQFYHVECEILGDMKKAMKIAEKFLLSTTKTILKEQKDVIMASAGTIDHVTQFIQLFEKHNGHLPQITLDEAIAIMPSPDYYASVEEGRPELGLSLKRKGERYLIEKFGGAVWLTEMDHLSTPFYQAYVDGSYRKKAKAADLLLGLGETLGLGERHKTAQEVCEALAHHEVNQNEYQWYVDMREVKPLKTSGWGMGTERYICWLLQHDDIRDIAILPRLKGFKYLP